jgi:hypothetical protein
MKFIQLIYIGFLIMAFGLQIPNSSYAQTSHFDDNSYPESESRSVSGSGIPPQLGLNKSYDPPGIWIDGSINEPQETRVKLSISGIGDPRVVFDPQDVVFITDTSGSMDLSDPANYRYSAARGYVESLLYPDRAAVIQFGYKAWLVNDHHLSTNYTQVLEDLAEEPKYRGQTNYEAAISLANKELIDNFEEGKFLIEIFFTDGNPDPKSNNVTLATINEAVNNSIMIYTIGLEWEHSPNPIDEELLKWMANSTGGEYFKATKPEQLFEIYQNISNRYTIMTSGSDNDVTDNEPMLREVLPNYIAVDEKSFSIEPDYINQITNGATILEWNISEIKLGDSWSVEFNISSTKAGNVSTSNVPASRARYITWDGQLRFDYFESKLLWVKELPPPPPPPLQPPPPPPPPPPPQGFGVPPPNPSLPIINPVVTIQPQLLPVAFETAVTLPVGFALAGFAALGMLERIKMKRKIKGKHKVAIGA